VRLWAQRRPGVATLLTMLVIAVAAGGGTGGWLYTIANERRVQEAVLRVELAEKDFQKGQAQAAAERGVADKAALRDTLGMMLKTLPLKGQMGAESSILTETALLEWLFSPRIVHDPEQLAKVWSKRLSVMRQAVSERLRTGHVSDLETLLLESTLGLWLTLDGDPAEAEQVLDRNATEWAKHVSSDDPWMARLDAMRNCAAARRVLDTIRASGPSPTVTCELDRLAGLLTNADKDLRNAGLTPIHLLVLWTLRDAYGPDGLNDRQKLALVKLRLTEYGSLANARSALRDGEPKPRR
jgi:hypothetical protein